MKIPILLYHALFDESIKSINRERYAISKNEFEKQVKYLSEKNFQSLLIDDLCKINNFYPNKRYIVITFDDGNYSDYSIAFPILKKYGLIATFFITTDRVGKRNFLSWSNIEEMLKNGMSIQSHGITHSFLPDLDDKDLYRELKESKIIIESNLSTAVNFFSVPGGFFSKKVLNIAKVIGYKGVCTSYPNLFKINLKVGEFSTFGRILVDQKTYLPEYKKITNANIRSIILRRNLYYLKNLLRKILGNAEYYKIWYRFFKEI